MHNNMNLAEINHERVDLETKINQFFSQFTNTSLIVERKNLGYIETISCS